MEKFNEQIKKLGESKLLVKILYILAILIIIKLIFFAGMIVGSHKASFGRAWDQHYNDNFGMGRRYSPNAHGATGKIIKIELPNIILQDKDNTEKAISLQADTKIEKGRVAIQTTELKVDDFIVVIGAPNTEGQIEAKFIRVMPNSEFINK